MAFISASPLPTRLNKSLKSSSTCVTRMSLSTRQKTKNLRKLLDNPDILLMPCCFDALSAKLVQRAEFPLTFLSGFSTAAVHGLPDTGLMSYKEMEQAILTSTAAIDIPLIADGDTGFGNALNVHRTVSSYVRAGASGILIEDQVNPKRCGHTKGKSVVDREEAKRRVKAACDARDAFMEGSDDKDSRPVVIARTDAARFDFEEAIYRANAFYDLGADVTFLEAPKSIEQMEEYCKRVPGKKLANMLEMGHSPILPPAQLQQIGYSIAAYPLTLLSSAIKAQELALQALKEGNPNKVQTFLKSFEDLKDIVGFNDYYEMEDKYK